jgi:hypothetical protein
MTNLVKECIAGYAINMRNWSTSPADFSATTRNKNSRLVPKLVFWGVTTNHVTKIFDLTPNEDDIKSCNAKLEEKILESQKKEKGYISNIENLEREMKNLTGEIQGKNNENLELTENIRRLEEQVKKEKCNSDLRKENLELKRDNEKLRGKVENYVEENQKVNVKIKENETRLKNQKSECEKKVEEIVLKIDNLEIKNKNLTEENQNYSSERNVVLFCQNWNGQELC